MSLANAWSELNHFLSSSVAFGDGYSIGIRSPFSIAPNSLGWEARGWIFGARPSSVILMSAAILALSSSALITSPVDFGLLWAERISDSLGAITFCLPRRSKFQAPIEVHRLVRD